MKRTLCILPLAAALLAGGCAYYKIQPISASSVQNWGKTDGPQEGYVFYQPELYFAATIATDSTSDKGAAQDEAKRHGRSHLFAEPCAALPADDA
jgi:hypothetical protein